MPTKTKRDEEKWDKAKELAAEQGRKEDYAYIMGIYKKMKPDYEFKNKKDAAMAERVASRFLQAGRAFSVHVRAVQKGFGEAHKNLDAMRNLINYRLGENERIDGTPIIDDKQEREARAALRVLSDAARDLDKAADAIHKKLDDVTKLDEFMGFN